MTFPPALQATLPRDPRSAPELFAANRAKVRTAVIALLVVPLLLIAAWFVRGQSSGAELESAAYVLVAVVGAAGLLAASLAIQLERSKRLYATGLVTTARIERVVSQRASRESWQTTIHVRYVVDGHSFHGMAVTTGDRPVCAEGDEVPLLHLPADPGQFAVFDAGVGMAPGNASTAVETSELAGGAIVVGPHAKDIPGWVVRAIGYSIPLWALSFLGFFVTALPTLTADNWRTFAIVRVAGHLGPSLMIGLPVIVFARRTPIAFATAALGLVLVGIGFLLARAPLFDLVEGPLRVHGVVEANENFYSRTHHLSSVDLRVRDDDGSLHSMSVGDWHAEAWTDARCGRGDRVDAVFLANLEAVLEARCTTPQVRSTPMPTRAAPTAGSAAAPLDLKVGASIQAFDGSDWWDATVLEARVDGTYRVHYVEWDSEYDQDVDRTRVRSRGIAEKRE